MVDVRVSSAVEVMFRESDSTLKLKTRRESDVTRHSNQMSSLIFNYVGTPNSNLICCICHAPFVRPVTTKTCAHTFCYECIVQALEHSPHCPVDRRSAKIEELVDAGGIVRAVSFIAVAIRRFDYFLL